MLQAQHLSAHSCTRQNSLRFTHLEEESQTKKRLRFNNIPNHSLSAHESPAKMQGFMCGVLNHVNKIDRKDQAKLKKIERREIEEKVDIELEDERKMKKKKMKKERERKERAEEEAKREAKKRNKHEAHGHVASSPGVGGEKHKPRKH